MSEERPQPPRDRLGCATFGLAGVGCIAIPFGVFLLAWTFLVSLVMVIGAARDGRRVSRFAVSALAVSVAAPLLWKLLDVVARGG